MNEPLKKLALRCFCGFADREEWLSRLEPTNWYSIVLSTEPYWNPIFKCKFEVVSVCMFVCGLVALISMWLFCNKADGLITYIDKLKGMLTQCEVPFDRKEGRVPLYFSVRKIYAMALIK